MGQARRSWGSQSLGALAAACFLTAPATRAVPAGIADPARLLEAEHLVTEILSEQADPAYGEYLGAECVTCHQRSGASNGIPAIIGLPIDYAVQALVEYKLGIRTNNVMQLMTKRLANAEIAALAAFFAGLEADPRQAGAD
jgi:cytochrome c553